MNLFVLVIFESITARDGFFSIVDSFFLSDELIRFLCETSAECLSSWDFFVLPDFLIDFIVLLGSSGLLINGAHYTSTSFFGTSRTWRLSSLGYLFR